MGAPRAARSYSQPERSVVTRRRCFSHSYPSHQLTAPQCHLGSGSEAPCLFHKQSLRRRIPKGSWDSHMHIIDPGKYPLVPDAVYRPSSFTVQDALLFESSVGINNMVLVQPSIYGHDNSCLLDALRRLGPARARGVVSFDPAKTPAAQLRRWHDLGVRGVRLNIQSNGHRVSREGLTRSLGQYANAVRSLGWVIQVYVPMPLVEMLEDIVPTLDVRVCIDHMGHPCLDELLNESSSDPGSAADPYRIRGFASLARLLSNGQIYVKLSAPYRVSRTHNHMDLEPMVREIIRLQGSTRVVFASDWPHTRFEGLDIRPWMHQVLDWCGNDNYLLERLFKGNAEELWDVSPHRNCTTTG